jgi:hypothetical protein
VRCQSVLGSVAYVGACRHNHLFAFDPQDPAGRRVLMLDNGGNVAPLAPTIVYAIKDRGRDPERAWLEDPMPITVEQALRRLPAARPRGASVRQARVRRVAA